ncbi:hypothetical protein RvY_16989 [Ramazzottius varieornatus]|uniref:SRR1-like domain-containing protein n=1 Tax=Ramazzottius varieornatus TaxID=947166 RepID=A0A1D1W6Q3_RAMVA|nr:hypothetical protein RvY_16989 [Ramazzottius varieornatus]
MGHIQDLRCSLYALAVTRRSLMDGNGDLRAEDSPFVFVKSRRRTGRQSRPSPKYASHSLFTEVHIEEYATSIHEIHLAIIKLRSRISQVCCADFLPNLVQSFKDAFVKYLGKLGPEEIVCYALGRFSTPTDWGRSCKLQLILLCELAENIQVPVSIFDPAFSPLENEYLRSEYCGFSVIDVNENGRRIAVRPTFFYMIHADTELYAYLIQVNRENSTLTNVILFGNTFDCSKKPFSRASLAKNVSSGQTVSADVLNFENDGEVRHVEVDTLPVKDRGGLFHAALTTDTVLHFFQPKDVSTNLCTEYPRNSVKKNPQ